MPGSVGPSSRLAAARLNASSRISTVGGSGYSSPYRAASEPGGASGMALRSIIRGIGGGRPNPTWTLLPDTFTQPAHGVLAAAAAAAALSSEVDGTRMPDSRPGAVTTISFRFSTTGPDGPMLRAAVASGPGSDCSAVAGVSRGSPGSAVSCAVTGEHKAAAAAAIGPNIALANAPPRQTIHYRTTGPSPPLGLTQCDAPTARTPPPS